MLSFGQYTMDTQPAKVKGALPPQLALAFAPVHKRALGIAVGLTVAFVLFGLTAFHVIGDSEHATQIELLSQYFYGYEVTWKGAFIGAFWGFVAGFVAGWFVAFVRNLVTAIFVFMVRAKAELKQTADFLDHI
jgi:hypothetical protein